MLAVFQPVGIFIAAILSLYAVNAGEVDFSSAHRSLVLAAGAAVAIWLGALRPLGDARKAALVTSLVALLFWSSSSIVSAIEKIAGDGIALPVLGVALLWLIALPLLARCIARTTRDLGPVYKIVDVAAAVVVLIPIATVSASFHWAPTPPVAPRDSERVLSPERRAASALSVDFTGELPARRSQPLFRCRTPAPAGQQLPSELDGAVLFHRGDRGPESR